MVLFDDVVTTARTLCQAAEAIRRNGAKDVYAGVTHGIFAPGAMERIEQSPIRELVVTDTICHSPDSIGRQCAGALGGRTAGGGGRAHPRGALAQFAVRLNARPAHGAPAAAGPGSRRDGRGARPA